MGKMQVWPVYFEEPLKYDDKEDIPAGYYVIISAEDWKAFMKALVEGGLVVEDMTATLEPIKSNITLGEQDG